MPVVDERMAASQRFAWPSLNALFADRVNQTPDKIFLGFPKAGATDNPAAFAYDEYTFGQVNELVNHLAASYALSLPPRRVNQPSIAVGLFAPSGFDYIIHSLALFRLGHVVVYLSTNNSTAALAHLVKVTSVKTLLYSADKAEAIAALKPMLEEQGLASVNLVKWTSVSEAVKLSLANSMDSGQYTTELSYDQESLEDAFVIHSSGSTGFPKPNFLKGASYLQGVGYTPFSSFGAFTTLPLFHMFGHTTLWSTILRGSKLHLYQDRLSVDLLVAAIEASGAQLLSLVPYVLKLLAESDSGVRALQSAQLVVLGGSAVPHDIGNRLVREHNVVLCLGYGASEISGVMSSARDYSIDKEWEYMRPFKSFRPFMKFENRGDHAAGPFELIVGAGWPCITVPNRADGSYATKDLFVPHPSIPDAYKCIGRADDTLVHVNGEKTNPVPMELEIRASPYVAECLVFGANRPQAGVLIVPSDLAVRTVEAQASSHKAVEQQLSKLLWTAVESANKEAPSHSQIIPELVKVLPAGTSFPSADKGSLIRAKVVQAFQHEIDQVYEAYETGSDSNADDVVKIKLLDMDASIEVTAQVISEVSQQSVPVLKSKLKDTDFVDLGIDSLKSTRVRNMLQKRIELASELPGNLVFEHPSVVQLAEYVFKYSFGSANGKSNGDSQQSESRKAVELLEEFKRQILKRGSLKLSGAHRDGSVKHTVVLTGSTGSLGAHLVDQLARISQVETVICLNRAKNDEDARKRTEDSLLTRGLEKLDRLASSSGTTIMCLAADLAEPQLGLHDSSWKLLSSKTTCVIHNGWPVNFNMAVQSFRGPIQGSVNLINLVAQSPATARPRFIFSSSISTIAGKTCSQVDEEYPVDIGDAANMGYGRSKWVVEKLCEYAQQHIGDGFDAVIARIGQMVGDRRSGIWNETEAWPLMLKSAQTIGCLPDLDEPISWQPVDDSAFFVAGMVMPPWLEGVFHVFNPAASSHSELIDLLKKSENLGDSFEVVVRSEWLRRLSESDPDPRRNPTIKLLEHYRAQYGQAQTNGNGAGDSPIKKQKIITNDRLLEAFEQLGLKREAESKLVPIDASLIHNMVSAWRRSGFLS